jgi:ADP-heptose:LPS heptosyltransferase
VPGQLLLLRLGAIGDALLTFPSLSAVRRARPGWSVTLATHPAVGPLAHQVELVDRFLSRDGAEVGALFAPGDGAARAALGRFEAACAWVADAEGRLGDNLRAVVNGPVLIQPSQPGPDDHRHVGQYLLDCLVPLGLGGQVNAEAVLPADRLPAPELDLPLGNGPLVVVHPGSGSGRKNWPLERYERLMGALQQGCDARLVLLIGPAEQARAFGLQLLDRAACRVLVERPLTEVAALLARCDLYVGNDSGPSHLAGLTGAPTLALFGPTDPRRWRPLGPRVTVLRRQPLEQLPVAEVLAAALGCLGQHRSGGPLD